MNAAFTVFYVVFLVSVVIYQLAAERRIDGIKNPGESRIFFKWTHSFINLGYIMTILLPAAEYFYAKRRINFIVSVIGACMAIFGIWGRSYSIKTLGKYWSGNIEIRNEHNIVRKGPYAFVRHPAYLAMIANGFGLCLVPNAYFSLALAFIFYVPCYIIRIILEEKVFVREIGAEYLRYKKEVPMLVPFARFGLKGGK